MEGYIRESMGVFLGGNTSKSGTKLKILTIPLTKPSKDIIIKKLAKAGTSSAPRSEGSVSTNPETELR